MNLLDRIQLSFRCPADWEAMEGDEKRRFCEGCRKHVHNLSAMTREEGEALVAGAGDLCVRMVRRADGSLKLKGCPSSVEVRTRAVRLAGAGLAAGGVLALSACEQQSIGDFIGSEEQTEPVIMGEIEAPEEVLMGGACPAEILEPEKPVETSAPPDSD